MIINKQLPGQNITNATADDYQENHNDDKGDTKQQKIKQ